MEILQLSGPEFLSLFIPLLFVAGGASAVLLYLLRPQGTAWTPDDPYELAYVRGGYRGVLEAATARLMHVKALTLDGDAQHAKLVKADAGAARGKVEQAVMTWASLDNNELTSGEAAVKYALGNVEDRLSERGVIADETSRWVNWALAMTPLAGMMMLGILKIDVGMGRNRPVGFLVMLELLILGGIIASAYFRPRLTRAGAKALEGAREESNALRHAGTGGSLGHLDSRDVMLSVALFGMAPLIGTELGPVHRYFKPPQSTGGSSCGGSSCSSSSCGSSCGGGCGGGCGGCGG